MKTPTGPTQAELLEMQEQAATMVASFTGLKAQFQDAGWSARGAEQMVYAVTMANSGSSE